MSYHFSTPEFESAYTYSGTDLGAIWSPAKTAFRVWAPTAKEVVLNLYKSGTPGTDDLIEKIPMTRDVKGTWTTVCKGDLNGRYYTYGVLHEGGWKEACDPYAVSTGVNGKRAMVLNLDSTNPEGWDDDTDPNAGIAFTDAVIYELHVRDLSIDDSSGIKNKGKFLGVIETGTKTPSGIPTGLDHIKSLGITHLHLLPVYDYGSVDESQLDRPQFNWGYDPVNFNTPEGSYSTDPFDGAVRVKEMKQMVKGLHDNGISVVMDVVYNHVFDEKTFCFNQIVPYYFSRTRNGKFSNGSACGNDTASERSMVRKYIVDSVCYWADEYHIDGFRFDLVGLIDVDTVNQIVSEVHKRHPNVVFYGEGWNLNTDLTKPCELAVQGNARLTPGFAYFNDIIRDAIRGSVFLSEALGFVTGAVGIGHKLDSCFRGMSDWCPAPTQTINYVSCHDNNTLLDRISLATPGRSFADRVRMSRLAAAFYLTAQGVPFMQAGEEMLRSKPDGKGGFVENSYKSPDAINSIKWNELDKKVYQDTVEYYKGLIAFRKAHPGLRMQTLKEIIFNSVPFHCDQAHVGAFFVQEKLDDGSKNEIFIVFSASEYEEHLRIPAGTWEIHVNGEKAGTKKLATVKDILTIPPISTMVLVRNVK